NYQGVDSLDEHAVVLLVRIRTLPGKHLAVGRAFNRLVKIAFDKHGIAGRDPTPMMITGALQNQADGASAAHETAARHSRAEREATTPSIKTARAHKVGCQGGGEVQ
ncbi:MAG TPA: hypothetical protein VHE81_17635, partial [Lacipirellulaceae bacterium]|nr:hypothetical protein [Lacipirellulaceae bacterium]